MNLLLNEKPVRMLQAITKQNGKKGINKLGKGCYSTYKSKYLAIVEFEKLGYVSLERCGREVIAYLTKKGEEAISHLNFFI